MQLSVFFIVGLCKMKYFTKVLTFMNPNN